MLLLAAPNPKVRTEARNSTVTVVSTSRPSGRAAARRWLVVGLLRRRAGTWRVVAVVAVVAVMPRCPRTEPGWDGT